MDGRRRKSGCIRHPGSRSRRADLSQHFLRSEKTAKRLVAASSITLNDLVVEAGPGDGALTAYLAAAASQVIAVELDRTLYSRLQSRFAGSQNVKLHHGDFLSYSLPAGQYSFFSNIPYARTADIVRKLVLGSRRPENAFLIMETVAATRFLGQPFGPESAFSLMLKARFHAAVTAWLDPREFEPPPSVNSVLLQLASHSNPPLPPGQLHRFDQFARSAFSAPNRSAISRLRKLLPLRQARSLIRELGFPANAPPSNIAFEHWLTVFKLIEWNRTE